MIRLSVTDLDQYLYWLSLEEEGPEWLIDRLTIREETPAMKAGTAFHGALEKLTNDASLLVHDGFRFDFQCDAQIPATKVRELKIEREILPGVILVGKVDAIDGGTVIDYKLTEKFDAERYTDSYQWRAYLMLFAAPAFEYSVFEAKPDGNEYIIRDHHSLKFFAYDGMKDDVLRVTKWLAEFVERFSIKEKMR